MVLTVQNLGTWLKINSKWLKAVDDVSFAIDQGKTLVLIGESGCGKSLTALSLMRLLPSQAYHFSHSKIDLMGINVLQQTENQMQTIRGNVVSMIFQDPMTSLNPVMTVGNQILEVLITHKDYSYKQAHQRTIELLDLVQIPAAKQRVQEFPHELSGGMKQRIMIAMALASEPKLLIADEPTTALDVTTQAQILNILKDVQQEKRMAMLMITHDLSIAEQMADDIAVMYAGQIIEKASAKLFFQQPSHPYSQQLFAALPNIDKKSHSLTAIPGRVPQLTQEFNLCRFLPRCQNAQEECQQRKPSFDTITNNHDVRCLFPAQPISKSQQQHFESTASEQVVLSVRNLKVHFPVRKGLFRKTKEWVKAVDDVSFDVHAGETLALVGESGCGKTTIGKAILSLLNKSSGEILYQSKDIATLNENQLKTMRSDWQIVFQDPYSAMNPKMRIQDILSEGLNVQKVKKKQQQRIIEQLLEQVGLSPSVQTRYPHEFSGGQRQRLCIARALSVNPNLLVCDEPTSALDVSVQAQVLNLLRDLQQQHQLSMLFITHNLSVVGYFADHVAVMYLGKIVEYGPVSQILQDPKHPYTQILLASLPGKDTAVAIKGEPPSPIAPPSGCHFHPRCPHAMDICRKIYPQNSSVNNCHVKCHLYT